VSDRSDGPGERHRDEEAGRHRPRPPRARAPTTFSTNSAGQAASEAGHVHSGQDAIAFIPRTAGIFGVSCPIHPDVLGDLVVRIERHTH